MGKSHLKLYLKTEVKQLQALAASIDLLEVYGSK